MTPAIIATLFDAPLDIEMLDTGRGQSWSLRGNRFRQRSDQIPAHLRRAFSCASSGGTFGKFLTEKCNGLPWEIELPCKGISLSRDLYYEWSVEHGYQVLAEFFASGVTSQAAPDLFHSFQPAAVSVPEAAE